MRYYNENPQTDYWRNKVNELEDSSRQSNELNVRLNRHIRGLEDELSKEKKRADDIIYLDKVYRRYFNSLPWYKKMFYKF